MWSTKTLKDWSRPALEHEELVEIARTASSNTQAKNQALEFTKEQGLDGQVAKACRWLRILRTRVSQEEFEEFVSSTKEEAIVKASTDKRGGRMADWRRDGIDWHEEKFEELRGKRKLFVTLFYVGYCSECDDITEVRHWRGGDDYDQDRPFCTQCMRCLTVCSVYPGIREDEKTIKVTMNKIPPKFQAKWRRMHGRTQQLRLLKEKAKKFIEELEKERQEIEGICEEARQRLGRFIS